MKRVLALALLVGCTPAPPDDDDTGAPDDDDAPEGLPRFCPDVDASVTGDGPWVVETEHYRIEIGASWSRAEAEELGRLAEASWSGFEDYFEGPATASDGERLDVVLSDTEGDWEAEIAADGLDVPTGAGGYFHTATERSYLYRQPTIYYTRVLLLHEMAHQYHRLARGSTADAGWFVEGVAEFLGRHDWDGECVRLGVLPLGTLEDLPADALDRWDQGVSLDEVVIDLVDVGRPLSMAVYRWLELDSGLDAAFADLRAALDAGVDDEGVEFEAVVGSLAAREDDFDAWLRREQTPIDPVYLEWLHVDPTTMFGFADGVVSLARVKDAPSTFSQTIRADGGRGIGGSLVEWRDSDHYTALLVEGDGAVVAFQVDDDGAFWWDLGAIDPPGDTVTWEQSFDDDDVVVVVDGVELRRPIVFPPAAGPAVNDSNVTFLDLRWTP